jgi:hypothetical protein
MSELLRTKGIDLFAAMLPGGRDDVTRAVLKTTHFVAPARIVAKPVVFPDCVHVSQAHHRDCRKGSRSRWQGSGIENWRDVEVWDNTKARAAIQYYGRLALNGRSRRVEKGWEVAHIWGDKHDPEYFTAGWNMCLMPSFLRDLVEEQQGNLDLRDLLRQIAWDLYFADTAAPRIPMPSRPVAAPARRIEVGKLIQDWKPLLIGE